MERGRNGPRQAGLRAILVAAAMLTPIADAAGDTLGKSGAGDGKIVYRSVVADALGGELKALSAMAASKGSILLASLDRSAPKRSPIPREPGPGAGLPERIDGETLDRIKVGERSAEWKCLAEAIYFEARGEGLKGQQAVAEVILNRVDSGQYPDSVCDVVNQGAGGSGCQFSYACDGRPETIRNRTVFDRIGKLAWVMLEGLPRTLTDKALFFHSTAVSPDWSRSYFRTARIGHHIFYRPQVRLSQK